MIALTEDKRMLGYELLSAYPNISHFVTTRKGGVGKESYATFNCSPFCGDEEKTVTYNQGRLLQGLPDQPLHLIIPRQTHETTIKVIDTDFLQLSEEQRQDELTGIDAVVTQTPGCCICVSTADCVPLLFYDKQHKVIAAVHAGWRGTVARIVSKTLQCLSGLYQTKGEDLIVAIGPSISKEAFEVGEEVFQAFQTNDFEVSRISLLNKKTGKYHIDLWEANRLELLAFGVPDKQIEIANLCTYTYHEIFFSARRLGIHSGRMLSGIMIHK